MSATTTQRRRRSDIPATRVISPSPTPSERQVLQEQQYSGPMTRSARRRLATPQPVEEKPEEEEKESKPRRGGRTPGRAKAKAKAAATAIVTAKASSSDSSDESGTADRRRARTRSRSPIITRRLTDDVAEEVQQAVAAKKKAKPTLEPVKVNGHLRPPEEAPTTSGGGWSWNDFSRSPSPLGLIPIHRQWRTFVHKHEVPRKALHVSIGFLVAWLYASGTQTRAVCPYLMTALLPIATVDLLRHRWPALNRLYVRLLGALMRESEFDGYNGVIFYLLGAWTVLYVLPKDVATVSVMLLSWCDTAASTFGRLWGRYTPRLRRNKSLAGSTAACITGIATAAWFWGWLAVVVGPMPGDAESFQFRGSLGLPPALSTALGLDPAAVPRLTGALALGVVSLWSGFVAAASEVVDLFGWDDNLTIPVLSGAGIWAFLRVFG